MYFTPENFLKLAEREPLPYWILYPGKAEFGDKTRPIIEVVEKGGTLEFQDSFNQLKDTIEMLPPGQRFVFWFRKKKDDYAAQKERRLETPGTNSQPAMIGAIGDSAELKQLRQELQAMKDDIARKEFAAKEQAREQKIAELENMLKQSQKDLKYSQTFGGKLEPVIGMLADTLAAKLQGTPAAVQMGLGAILSNTVSDSINTMNEEQTTTEFTGFTEEDGAAITNASVTLANKLGPQARYAFEKLASLDADKLKQLVGFLSMM